MSLKEILKKNDFTFQKRFGQNFLTDGNLLDSIVEKAGIGGNDTVVEVGCGGGTLTAAIAKKAKRVIGFEIDGNLKPVLKETLAEYDNTEIIFRDVMKVSAGEIERIAGGDYAVVANLPYYITTPVLMKFLEEGENVTSVTVTVQEEVADRLCALPGTPEYGAITVAVNAAGNAEKVMRIGRNLFYPVPNVDSAVVKITIDRDKYDAETRAMIRSVVRAAFQSRRKTLVNNLMQAFKISRAEAESAVAAAGIEPMTRGETLGVEDYRRLAERLKERSVLYIRKSPRETVIRFPRAFSVSVNKIRR